MKNTLLEKKTVIAVFFVKNDGVLLKMMVFRLNSTLTGTITSLY